MPNSTRRIAQTILKRRLEVSDLRNLAGIHLTAPVRTDSNEHRKPVKVTRRSGTFDRLVMPSMAIS